ncbi:MAG: efflux RND transporter permease subunit [Alphaproteobacteria bacterium]
MIASIIRWSARNIFLVLFGVSLAVLAGIYAVTRIPLDAIPDLSDTQVIVYTEYPGQAAQVVEDQVTFPLATALLSVPRARVVRGTSFFGVSFVYVIFQDGTDIYWARSRVLEYLSGAISQLPQGVTPTLGPDATGVGWVYQYALTGKNIDLQQLRSVQDWQVRFALANTQGVAEVASVGGFVKQYAVVVDPNRMRAFGVTLESIQQAIAASNVEVGGRTIELGETEFMIRGRGYLRGIEDLKRAVLKAQDGTPVVLGDVARVEIVPFERRGIAELNGDGEVVGGIILQRYGANALDVIHAVKEKIAGFLPSLPKDVTIVPAYDRSQLVERAIHTLARTLTEESVIVALVCFIFLLHFRSALVVILTLPVGVLIAFAIMNHLGIGSNIMSLGGIAIAIGAMVDAAIVMVENAHKRLERAEPGASRATILVESAVAVGPALFFSLLIITISFLPIFTLEEQEGRLFKPLAFTKTFAMAAAALLSVTLVPALMLVFVRGKIRPEASNPINRFLTQTYRPVIASVLKVPRAILLGVLGVMVITLIPLLRIGAEFMPTLNEGTLLFMPTTLPGLSVTKAGQMLQAQDKIIKSFPEVESVWGKAGRAETGTDPAPLEMFETTINLKPESEWRKGMTLDKLIMEMNEALQFPGVSNAWTMPIKARIDMLATGIRTPVGVKIFGKDLNQVERLSRQVEAAVKTVQGTTSAYAERVNSGYYLEITPDRDQVARYGLSVKDVQSTIANALGAQALTTTVEGRERYTVALRYPRDVRSDPDAIASDVVVSLPNGSAVPLGTVAKIARVQGPTMIRTEGGQLVNYVYVDFQDRDLGSFVRDAQRAVAAKVSFPAGYFATWSGQFEYLERAQRRLLIVVPATLLIIFLLLFLNFRRLSDTLIVMLSLPFALVGGLWFMYLLNFNMSVAAAVGFIALAGVAAETAVVMLIYLNSSLEEVKEHCRADGHKLSQADVYRAVITGAAERVRPVMMTVAAIIAGLVPILWATGTGSEVMRRIAVPMIGGMVSATALTLLVIPTVYYLVKVRRVPRQAVLS